MIEKPARVEPSKPVVDEKPNGNGDDNVIREVQRRVGPPRGRRPKHPMGLVFIGAISVIAILAFIPSWIQKWLWMRQVGYAGIFWTLFSVRWGLFGAAFVVALLYLWINLHFAVKNSATFRVNGLTGESAITTRLGAEISPAVLKLAVGAMAAVAALFFALLYYAQWDNYLRFRYGGSFGLSDPLFGRDAGFYMFSLPFYELLQSSLNTLAVATFLAVLAFCVYFASLGFSRGRPVETWGTKVVPHLSGLFFVLVASWGWGFYLDHFELLYSTQGVVYGAGYTAAHVTRIAYWIMVAAAVALCALLAFNIFRPRLKSIAIGFGFFATLYIAGVWLAPALFQRFVVQPNELARETPFLKNNIAFTLSRLRWKWRRAFCR